MKRYAIADYLSDEDRQRILAHRFVMQGEETGERDPEGLPLIHQSMIPLSADDQFCPLAYLPGISRSAPSAVEVALAIRASGNVDYISDNFDAIANAAREFIDDWDAGRIPPAELAAVLGMAAPS